MSRLTQTVPEMAAAALNVLNPAGNWSAKRHSLNQLLAEIYNQRSSGADLSHLTSSQGEILAALANTVASRSDLTANNTSQAELLAIIRNAQTTDPDLSALTSALSDLWDGALSLTGAGGAYTFTNSEAAALVARMSLSPSDTRKGLIDAYFTAIKLGATSGSNILAKLDVDYHLAAHDAQAAGLNWVGDVYNLTAVGGPTFTVDQGYTGDGVGAYLATGYTSGISAGVASQNSTHIGAWSKTDLNTTTVEIGSNAISMRLRDTGSFRTQVNGSLAASPPAVADSLGHFVASRTAAAVVGRYKNGASLGNDTTTASSAPVNSPLIILGRNSATNGTITLALPSAKQLASAHAGSGLTAAEAADLYAAKAAFLAAIAA